MPESDEAYRSRVRGYLVDRDPLQVLRCTPTELEQLLADLPRTAVSRRPRPEKWSPLEIVAHMFDAELVLKGADVQSGPVSRPWGLREFEVLDPEGNRLTFGEPFD